MQSRSSTFDRSPPPGADTDTASGSEITFVRLTEISADEILEHMRAARVTQHMPLATDAWDASTCEAFIQAKETCWQRDGLGHWGIRQRGVYVGWGGFQKEGSEWDFGLVLKPEYFGLGIRITKLAIAFAFADERIPFVTFLLPPSRKHLRGLERLGARFIGAVDHAGRTFLKYRLDTE